MGGTHQQVQFILPQKMQKKMQEVLTTQPASQYCTIQGFLRVLILQKRGCSIQALHQLAGAPLIDFWAG